jgi:mannose-6-phosphate isomerase
VEQALACIDFGECSGGLTAPVTERTTPVLRQRIFDCDKFRLSRLRSESPFAAGVPGLPGVLVCIEGAGQLEHGGAAYHVTKGDVYLLPAAIGPCTFLPHGAAALLEIAIPA